MQRRYVEAQAAVLPVALDGDAPDCADLSRLPGCSGPDGLFVVLCQRCNCFPFKLRVLGQPGAVQACKPVSGANPESPISRGQQSRHVIAGKMCTRRRLPWVGANTIETKKAEFRAQPDISVGRLSNRVDPASGKAFAIFPGGMRVLAYVQRWVERERTRAACRDDAAQRSRERETTPQATSISCSPTPQILS